MSERDCLLFRPSVFALSQRDTIADESQRPIVWVHRRRPVVLTTLAALAAMAIVGIAGFQIYPYVVELIEWNLKTSFEILSAPTMTPSTLIVIALLAIATSWAVATLIAPRHRFDFYRDAAHTDKLIELEQDGRWQFVVATYSLRDPDGNVLARFRRNRVLGLLCDRWTVTTPDGGTIVCHASEGPIALAPLRHLLGTLDGLLRTNTTIHTADARRDTLGRFDRRRLVIDRRMLDLTADPTRTLDRRVAVALGALLNEVE